MSNSVDFNIDNDLNLDKATEALSDAEPNALMDILEMIGQRTDEIIPFEEGTLMRSKVIRVNGNQGAIGYDTPYAIKQHEDCTLDHPGGRKCKYLERTVKGNRDAVQEIWRRKFGDVF